LKKKAILFSFLISNAVAGFCQLTSTATNSVNNSNLTGITDYKLNFTINNTAFTPAGLHSVHGRGNSLMNSGSVFDMLSNRFNIMVPVRYHYAVKGIDFQAGLLTNSRQPRLGAGFSSPSGFNFSAGYGVGMPNVNKLGYSPLNSKSQGIQFTAGYRLFGRKR
jgi:hypothetical protein